MKRLFCTQTHFILSEKLNSQFYCFMFKIPSMLIQGVCNSLWDVVLKRHALKSNILQPVFNLRDDGALMESGAACSCLQSALDDCEAAFVSAVLFFLLISIHVVLYIFYIYCLRNATERNCRRHRTFTSHQEFLVCDVLYVQNVHVVTSF